MHHRPCSGLLSSLFSRKPGKSPLLSAAQQPPQLPRTTSTMHAAATSSGSTADSLDDEDEAPLAASLPPNLTLMGGAGAGVGVGTSGARKAGADSSATLVSAKHKRGATDKRAQSTDVESLLAGSPPGGAGLQYSGSNDNLSADGRPPKPMRKSSSATDLRGLQHGTSASAAAAAGAGVSAAAGASSGADSAAAAKLASDSLTVEQHPVAKVTASATLHPRSAKKAAASTGAGAGSKTLPRPLASGAAAAAGGSAAGAAAMPRWRQPWNEVNCSPAHHLSSSPAPA